MMALDGRPDATAWATWRNMYAISMLSVCGRAVSPKPALVLIVTVNAPLLLAMVSSDVDAGAADPRRRDDARAGADRDHVAAQEAVIDAADQIGERPLDQHRGKPGRRDRRGGTENGREVAQRGGRGDVDDRQQIDVAVAEGDVVRAEQAERVAFVGGAEVRRAEPQTPDAIGAPRRGDPICAAQIN